MKILVATRNPGKRREYADLLADLDTGDEPVDWLMLEDLGIDTEVEEIGETFEENAILKATTYAAESGLLTLADDSGLAVAVLGGAPGVYSARYAGPGATDLDRYQKLLREMEDIPPQDRTARFVCVVTIATPDGEVFSAEGDIKGQIAFEPSGSNGFGYDPVFYIPGLHTTMAQLDSDTKNKISHRAVALGNIKPTLQQVIAARSS